jgi:pimeloyl-ACP methyl ester carboxylesterase
MKTKLLLSLLLIGTLFQANAQELSSIIKPRPTDFENLSGLDSISARHPLIKPNDANRNVLAAQNLPYPIIFIHGLNSSSDTWFDMGSNLINKGLSFGGRIDFCLNDDGNNYTSNKNVWTSTNNNIPAADIALYTDYNADLTVADFYFLNFNIDNFGRLPNNTNFSDVLSNESAIVKQGVALKIAIQMVLLKTGRDKVILMGHSMGGLAAREYIQNPINWQADGQHHVAKLITTGTPHGGFNGLDISPTINSRSEAFRDLKSSYVISGLNGVYLFGGLENYSVMNNNLLYDFYNVDVNCNGLDSDNNYILGLNQKDLYSNLDYSCIIGNVINLGGDGLVDSTSANLNTYYANITTNLFNTSAIHTSLPSEIYKNIQGLDEPYQYNLAYGIDYDKLYVGFISEQATNAPFVVDFDEYKFIVSNNSLINLVVNNGLAFPIYARILNSSLSQVGPTFTVNNGNNIFSQNLPVGQYYLEIYGAPTSNSYLTPYAFGLTYTLSNEDFVSDNSFTIYPNPTTSAVFFDNTKHEFTEVQVFNYLGQEVAREQLTGAVANQEINLSNLSAGVYLLKFHNGSATATAKVVKQ